MLLFLYQVSWQSGPSALPRLQFSSHPHCVSAFLCTCTFFSLIGFSGPTSLRRMHAQVGTSASPQGFQLGALPQFQSRVGENWMAQTGVRCLVPELSAPSCGNRKGVGTVGVGEGREDPRLLLPGLLREGSLHSASVQSQALALLCVFAAAIPLPPPGHALYHILSVICSQSLR